MCSVFLYVVWDDESGVMVMQEVKMVEQEKNERWVEWAAEVVKGKKEVMNECVSIINA